MDNEQKLKAAVLIADLNNFLMLQSFNGDNMLNAAKLIGRCGELFRELVPQESTEETANNGE